LLYGTCSYFVGTTYYFTTGSSFLGGTSVEVATGLAVVDEEGEADKLFKAFSASATFYLV
jgi:hypothetical protein